MRFEVYTSVSRLCVSLLYCPVDLCPQEGDVLISQDQCILEGVSDACLGHDDDFVPGESELLDRLSQNLFRYTIGVYLHATRRSAVESPTRLRRELKETYIGSIECIDPCIISAPTSRTSASKDAPWKRNKTHAALICFKLSSSSKTQLCHSGAP